MCQTLCMHGREDINMNMTVSKMNTEKKMNTEEKRATVQWHKG